MSFQTYFLSQTLLITSWKPGRKHCVWLHFSIWIANFQNNPKWITSYSNLTYHHPNNNMLPEVFKYSSQNLANFTLFVEHVNNFYFKLMDLYVYELLFLKKSNLTTEIDTIKNWTWDLERRSLQSLKSTQPDQHKWCWWILWMWDLEVSYEPIPHI